MTGDTRTLVLGGSRQSWCDLPPPVVSQQQTPLRNELKRRMPRPLLASAPPARWQRDASFAIHPPRVRRLIKMQVLWACCHHRLPTVVVVAAGWLVGRVGGSGGWQLPTTQTSCHRHFIFPTLRAVLFYRQVYITESIRKRKQVGKIKIWVDCRRLLSLEESRRSRRNVAVLMHFAGPSACNSLLQTCFRRARGPNHRQWVMKSKPKNCAIRLL